MKVTVRMVIKKTRGGKPSKLSQQELHQILNATKDRQSESEDFDIPVREPQGESSNEVLSFEPRRAKILIQTRCDSQYSKHLDAKLSNTRIAEKPSKKVVCFICQTPGHYKNQCQ
jgi:hypothetical protein